MKFQIKHAIKGRIRFHVDQKKQMTCEQADILLYYLENMEGVESVKVYDRTADAVVCYKADADGLVHIPIDTSVRRQCYFVYSAKRSISPLATHFMDYICNFYH